MAEKSLMLTNSKSVESAINWIEEHQDDADFEEELIITDVNDKTKPKRTKEEIEALAKELSKVQHEKFKQKEKLQEIENEKFRVQQTKEMMKAKQLADEAEERRLQELRRIEKTKLEQEKKKMEETLKRDKELRFGKKFDNVVEEKKEPAFYFHEGLRTLTRV